LVIVVPLALAARRGHECTTFVASIVYLATMLGGAAFALFPVLLPTGHFVASLSETKKDTTES
jgi:cytochrome bd-type quinol oxidase subunit 2